jgi:hypothetical protein
MQRRLPEVSRTGTSDSKVTDEVRSLPALTSRRYNTPV